MNLPAVLALLLSLALGCASGGEKVSALRQKADAGDPYAQLALGQRYAAGDGVEQDPARAAGLYRKAAEAGSTEAQFSLGVFYRDGFGVAQDHREAERWIRKAAQAGNAKARFLLGTMYENGDGLPRDPIAAHAWLNLAAAGLPPEERQVAARHRDWLADVMTPAELAEAQKLAREWGQGAR